VSNLSHYLIFKHKLFFPQFKINILVLFYLKKKTRNKQIKSEIYSRKIIQNLKLTKTTNLFKIQNKQLKQTKKK